MWLPPRLEILESRTLPTLDLGFALGLGSAGSDVGRAVAADGAGNVYVTGRFTGTVDFDPDPGPAVTRTATGPADGFLAKYTPGGALLWVVGLGGSGDDAGQAIAVDGGGNVYVGGITTSDNFPTQNALQPTRRGGPEAFVTKLAPTGALVYSTYLGGNGHDDVLGVAVDATGAAYVTGQTASPNFPTASPIQSSFAGGATDVFVAKLNPLGSALVYSTYLGRGGNDVGSGIAVDGTGNAYVTGSTRSSTFLTTPGAYQRTFLGSADGFVTKFDPTGSVVYSTLLGGHDPLGEGLEAIAVDAAGNAYVTGSRAPSASSLVNPVPGGYGHGPIPVYVG